MNIKVEGGVPVSIPWYQVFKEVDNCLALPDLVSIIPVSFAGKLRPSVVRLRCDAARLEAVGKASC